MAHGFSATRSMTIDKYAEAFQSKGFAVLLFDHRGFGASGGEPRIRAVVVQVPAFGETPPPPDSDGRHYEMLRKTALSPDVLNYGRPTLGPVPVVSADQVRQPSALKPLSAFRWFIEYGGRIDSGWVNDVTIAIGDTPTPWQPALCGPHIDVPVLMIVAPEDEMARANPSVARLFFESLNGPKEWQAIAGGHFGLLYHPSDIFDEAQQAQVSFLSRWLGDEFRAETRMRSTAEVLP